MTWRRAAVGAASLTFVLGMLGCLERRWHAPQGWAIALIYAIGIALGVAIARKRARTAMSEESRLRTRRADRSVLVQASVLGAMTASGGALLVVFLIDHLGSLFLSSVLGSLWMGSYPLHPLAAHMLLERPLTIGIDGLRIGSQAIPYRLVRAVRQPSGEPIVEVQRADGETIRYTCTSVEAAAELAGRITTRLESSGDLTALRARIGRDGRTLDVWKRELLSSDYRSSEISTDDAMRVLRSGMATHDERLGAAIVIASRAAPGARERERIRIVASECVDRRLRVALEQAADDQLGDESVARALARS